MIPNDYNALRGCSQPPRPVDAYASGMEEFSIDLTIVGVNATVPVQLGDGRQFTAKCRLQTKVRHTVHPLDAYVLDRKFLWGLAILRSSKRFCCLSR